MRTTLLILCMAVAYCSAEQAIILDKDIIWNGPGQFYGPYEGPTNWVSPVDYRQGFLYRRVEVLEKPTDIMASIQSCLWDTPPPGETCGSHGPDFDSKGVYYFRMWGPNWWWKKDEVAVDWDKPGRRGRLLVAKENTLWLVTCGGGHCYSGAGAHLPIKVHMEEIVTSDHGTLVIPERFSHWECQEEWDCEGGQTSAKSAAARASSDPAIRFTRLASGNIRFELEKKGTVNIRNLRGETAATLSSDAGGIAVIERAALAPGTYVAADAGMEVRAGSIFVMY